jgi:hypothetical protein
MLENYEFIRDGKTPQSETNEENCINLPRYNKGEAVYVLPKIMKADLDMAIQGLKSMEKSIIIALNISNFTYGEVGFWWNRTYLEIVSIEEYSIRKLRRLLNGEELHNDAKSSKRRDSQTDESSLKAPLDNN